MPRQLPGRASGSDRRLSNQITDAAALRGGRVEILTESLILAQDERWRRASYMQVERGPSGLPEKT